MLILHEQKAGKYQISFFYNHIPIANQQYTVFISNSNKKQSQHGKKQIEIDIFSLSIYLRSD